MTQDYLWTCPYCNRDCTIGEKDVKDFIKTEFISEEYGHFQTVTTIVICPNPKCRELTILLNIFQSDRYSNTGEKLYSWALKPESIAKPLPGYIPLQLTNDYKEACLIKDKSPKSSATLSRRCLQGMINDFWGITKNRLVDQINELQNKVDSTTWQAINSVRKIGNIGAHMEKDVNLIIEVEPDEAGLLIWLIETLFEEWYIARHNREEKMNNLIQIAQDKKLKQQSLQPSTTKS